jgi:hypothetical protein
VLEDRRRWVGVFDRGGYVLGDSRPDELPLGDELREQGARAELLPVREAVLGQEAEDAPVGVEDLAVRVAEGSGLEQPAVRRRPGGGRGAQLGAL